MSIAGPAGWCEDATRVALLELGEVDAADASPPPFFAYPVWWRLCRPRHNYLMILSTASAFRLSTLAKGALLALLLALGGCGGGGGAQPEPLPCHGYGCAYFLIIRRPTRLTLFPFTSA